MKVGDKWGGEKLLPHYDKNKITAFFSFIKTLYIGGARSSAWTL